MTPVQLILVLGFEQPPEGPCLGLRAGTDSLESDGLCKRYFASYQCQNLADFIPRNMGPVMIVGHSFGGGRVAKAIPELIKSGGHCESVVLIEPVQCDGLDWLNIVYRFDPLPVNSQKCFYCYPPVWGRRFRDEWLNEGIPHEGEGLNAHSTICGKPRVLNYIAEQVQWLANQQQALSI